MSWLYLGSCGMLLGLSALVRPISLVYLPALVIVYLTAGFGARRTLARERPNLVIENGVVHADSAVNEVFAPLRGLDYPGFARIDGVHTNLRHLSVE